MIQRLGAGVEILIDFLVGFQPAENIIDLHV